MTTEPKLLTEAEWLAWMQKPQSTEKALTDLRARGLIAEEPDAIHRLAAEICAKLRGTGSSAAMVKEVEGMIRRRCIELAPRKELTREMVRGAVIGSEPNLLISPDFRSCHEETRQEAENFVDRLHAAIQEALL